ncbi:hypothetical protein BCR34DRAFT_605443 [Clohesyomyces aquaticus]|uniref:Uncharacterized protein n=1 Tax=Clohesyomyces aquaticus TaxID=1231657 RepID=A0A1Y1YXS4_9PLEO|nr:hypothetical protein BCR34DRAFT_605443 [Clohesyomyces aquaticus]
MAHKEAALVNNQSTTAMALLGRLTQKLLKRTASPIETMDLHIGKPLTPTKLNHGPDASGVPHVVLKEGQLRSNERYLVDKSCRISSQPKTYDATETKDLDYFASIPFRNQTRAQRDNLKLERENRLHLAKFVDTNIDVDILNGSAVQFKEKLDDLVDGLKL